MPGFASNDHALSCIILVLHWPLLCTTTQCLWSTSLAVRSNHPQCGYLSVSPGPHRAGRRCEPPGEGDQRRVLERADDRISRRHDARRAEQRGVGAQVRGTLTAGVGPQYGGRPSQRRGRPLARGISRCLRGASADRANESIPYPPSRQHSKPTASLESDARLGPRTHTPISGYTRVRQDRAAAGSVLTAGDQLHRIWPRVGDGSGNDAMVS